MPRTHRQHWTSEDRQARRYRYVSFDVPPGAAGVAVHLDYDASLAVVDLGVLDPEGFRGYSGGARDRFAITGVAATPGYLPG
ncbi:MAG: PHP domain-containing protein, partial [Euzebyales bacterium]|nr:PHP domain-containing protein [Euzebyales bacterium]